MRSCVVLLLTLFFHACCVCGQAASTGDSPSPDRSIHDWIVEWRENPNDAVYNVPGFLIALPITAALVLLDTGPERKSDGR